MAHEARTDCPSTTELSGGSAAFTIVAIMLGLLAQPEGSLCLPEEESVVSIWRFSPLHSLLEAATIVISVSRGFWLNQKHSSVAIALMVHRTPFSSNDKRPLREVIGRPKLELTIPLTLQLVKLVAIKGSLATQIFGLVYWSHWAAVQWVHYSAYTATSVETTATRAKLEARWTSAVSIPKWFRGIGVMLMYALELFTFVTAILPIFAGLTPSENAWPVWFLVVMVPFFLGSWSVLYILFRTLLAMFVAKYVVGTPWDDKFWNLHAIRGVGIQGLVWVLTYYIIFYETEGTYRPPWLDWLG